MIYYRVRIRNAADSADALTLTSVASGTNPYISQPPTGDGQGFDPRSGRTEIGAYTILVADNGSGAAAVTGFLADASGRYDKLGRRTYLEYGTDGATYPNQLVAGFLNTISFPSAAEAQLTIGEAQRGEESHTAFDAATATFPATTMLAGGPIRTTIPWIAANVPNHGPWRMKVYVAPSSAAYVPLQFQSGYVLASDDALAHTFVKDGHLPIYTWQRINTLCASETAGRPGLDVSFARWALRNVYVDVYTTAGALVGTFPVYRTPATLTAYNFDEVPAHAPLRVLDDTNSLYADFTGVASPASGTLYDVYLYSRTISESNPLHVYLHPMDIITGLITEAGGSYDATTAAAVRAEIGDDVRLFLRLTSSSSTSDYVNRLLGLFGLGRRVNSSNVWEFFSQRAKGTAPATTLTYDDLREIPSEVWTLDEASIVNRLTVTQQRFSLWAPGGGGSRPADNLVATEQTRTADYQLTDLSYPSDTQGVHEVTYTVDGTITSDVSGELDLEQFTRALAAPAFDRWGFGAPRTTIACRETATTALGDEVALGMSFLPNGVVRGGARIVQVVRRTNEPGGPVLVVEDGGLAAQPSVSPTFTVTANAGAPLAVADVALTNAAALTAAGVQAVLVEWIVSAGAPAIAGQDLGAIIPAAPITLSTPPVAAGSKVWARAKSVQPGRRPSAFTAWASVTLSSVGAPGSLTATASGTDGSTETLTWTAGSNSTAYRVEVLVRSSAAASGSDRVVAQLLPGSLRHVLEGLTPSTSYTATVRYVDANSGITVATSSVTFTAGATTKTLSAPGYAAGFSGSRDTVTGSLVRDGVYGIGVVAADYPGATEVAVATETAVGSGAYGAFVTAGQPVPNVLGDWTAWKNTAPNDGLRRQLKARHVRDGTTASSYSAIVTVTPWTPVALPSFPTQVFYDCDTSESAGVGTVTVVVNDPLSAMDPTSRVTFTRLELGVKTTGIVATTSPSAGITTGTYTYSFALDEKHPITIGVVGNNRNGTTTKVQEFTFDFDKLANVVNLDIAPGPTDATVTVTVDTDAKTGAGAAEYSVNGGAFTGFTINALTRVGSFTVAETSVTQALRVRALDPASVAGPIVEGTIPEIPAAGATGPLLDVRVIVSSTQYQFVATTDPTARLWWRYDAATTYTNVGVDGTQTLTLSRNASGGSDRPVSIKAIDTLGDESNPPFTGVVLAQAAGTYVPPAAPGFSAVSFSGAPDYALDQIDISWVPDNAPGGATYNVTIYEQTHPTHADRGKVFEAIGVTAPYTYQCQNDIALAGGLTKYFTAYVSMIDGFTVVVDSSTVSVTLPSNT